MSCERVFDLLLAEDNPSDVELTLRALRKSNLVNPVFVVNDGQEVLDYVFRSGAHKERRGEKLPRAILLDLKLPKISGLDVLRAIKSDGRTKSVPVIVLTSSKEDPDIKAAYRLGANSYVVKPVEFNAFIDAMGNLGSYWLLLNEPPK